MTAYEISQSVREQKITAVEVCRAFINKIEDDRFNAFITRTFEDSFYAAEEIDNKIRKYGGKELKLAGVPIAVKDNICVDSVRTTCASKMLYDFVPSYSATAYKKLAESGAVLIGKTNLDEFAMGSENIFSYFGRTKNPYNENKVTGGSSGGSAVSVAAGYSPIALGTDTGGSARLPASLCGITAMKPTYGRVSRFGLISFAPSFEQICPMTRSVYDNALVLDVISGQDRRDMMTFDTDCSFTNEIENGVENIMVGVYVPGPCDDCIVESIFKAAHILKHNGAKTEIVSLDSPEEAGAVYITLSSAEAASTLSRYDGIKYGYSHQGVISSRTEGFGSKVKERIAAGAIALLRDKRELYEIALYNLEKIKSEISCLFEQVDILLMPASDRAAWPSGENDNLIDRFLVYANLTGCPSITVPVGSTDGGLPLGIGIMGKKLSESILYRAAYVIENECEDIINALRL